MAIMGKVPDAEVASDLDATLAWAARTGKADTAGSASRDSAGAAADLAVCRA